MSFVTAAGMTAMDGIEVRAVLTIDDVASVPRDRQESRRGGAGGRILDLLLELAQLDLSGRVAKVRAADRSAGPHPDLRLQRQAIDGDMVDARLSFADRLGEADRDHDTDPGRNAVLLCGHCLVGGDRRSQSLCVAGSS